MSPDKKYLIKREEVEEGRKKIKQQWRKRNHSPPSKSRLILSQAKDI